MAKSKEDKQILDEIDKCWEEYHNIADSGQIQLRDLLKDDPAIFEKNITWVGNKKEMHPFYYVNLNGKQKILIDYPYQEIDIKAFRDGELYYNNKLLRIIN